MNEWITVSSQDENNHESLPAGMDLLDLRPPPTLTRQYTLGRDELLPGAAPFLPVEPVVNGEAFAPLLDGVVGYDIWDLLSGDVPEDELDAMGWEGYITEHEEIDDSDDDDESSSGTPPPAA